MNSTITTASDYQSIVEELQSAILSPEAVDEEFLRDVAVVYAEACSDANVRLREVAQLLNKGLWSDAIQYGEREPNLLDVVALLDFPELAHWCTLLETRGVVLPPPLLTDVAADLNEAYAKQQPLEALLKKHRLLALARAPLSARLTVLNRIRESDPSNPTWEEELGALEVARLKEIAEEAESAIRAHDLSALASLDIELQLGDWHTPPEKRLCERVAKHHAALAQKAAREELEQIGRELDEAYAAFDVERGRSLRERWNGKAEAARVEASDPLSERAAPAFEWLEQQDQQDERQQRYNAACRELGRLLDEDRPRDELERGYEALVKCENGVPGEMATRYANRISAFDLRARRVHRLAMLGVIGLLLVLGACVWFAIRHQRFQRDVADHTNALSGLIDRNMLDEAAEYYENLTREAPRVADSAELQEQALRLQRRRKDERRRVEAFGLALSEVARLLDESESRLADARESLDNRTVVYAAWDAVDLLLRSVTEHLDAADDLVSGDSERVRLADHRARLAAIRASAQTLANEPFSQELAAMQERLDRIEAGENSDFDQQNIELTQLAADVGDLLSAGNRRVGAALISVAKNLRTRIRSMQQHRATIQRKRIAINEVTKTIGDPGQYRTALRTFVNRYPQSNEAPDFKQTLEDAEEWDGMTAWERYYANHHPGEDFVRPEIAKTLVDDGQDLLQAHGNLPPARLFADSLPFLKQVVARSDGNGGTVARSLNELFGDRLMANSRMVELDDGSRFYVADMLKAAPGRVRFRYFCNLALDVKPRDLLKEDVKFMGLTPQAELSWRTMQRLRDLTHSNWEETFCSIAQDVVAHKTMDNILQIIVLKRVIRVGATGSYCCQFAFKPVTDILDSSEIDLSVNWVDPGDTADEARRQAQQLLNTVLPRCKESGTRALELRREWYDRMNVSYTWIGWLRQDEHMQWQCLRRSSDEPTGELFVLRRSPGGEGMTEILVGRMQKGVITWSSSMTDSDAIVQGLPVYLRTR